jgi:hypothetical protein
MLNEIKQKRRNVGYAARIMLIYLLDSKDRCLADLRFTDPRDDRARIEQTKGGLLKDSYKWILDQPDFR